jgi:hypothetical protein
VFVKDIGGDGGAFLGMIWASRGVSRGGGREMRVKAVHDVLIYELWRWMLGRTDLSDPVRKGYIVQDVPEFSSGTREVLAAKFLFIFIFPLKPLSVKSRRYCSEQYLLILNK